MDEYIKRSDALAKYQFERIDGEVKAVVLTGDILDIPAADVRPARRGKWETAVLDGPPGMRPIVSHCSCCNHVCSCRWYYCPNCGADMREDGKDG